MTERTRSDLLVALADAVNELVEPRSVATRYESSVRARNGTTKRSRRTHVTLLPALLDSLAEAIEPGNDGEILSVGSFESKPSADMTAIAAAARIQQDVTSWCTALEVKAARGLKATIRSLVSTTPTDTQLRSLVRDAERWVKSANIATGFEAAPMTIDRPCPVCGKPNALVASGDLNYVKCGRCKVDWPEDMLGLLTQQLEANLNHATMTSMERCDDERCYRRGVHMLHEDGSGRYWLDEATG